MAESININMKNSYAFTIGRQTGDNSLFLLSISLDYTIVEPCVLWVFGRVFCFSLCVVCALFLSPAPSWQIVWGNCSCWNYFNIHFYCSSIHPNAIWHQSVWNGLLISPIVYQLLFSVSPLSCIGHYCVALQLTWQCIKEWYSWFFVCDA